MKGKKSDRIATKPYQGDGLQSPARRGKKYVKPQIISFSGEEILERLGSAKACSFSGGVTCNGPTSESGPPMNQ